MGSIEGRTTRCGGEVGCPVAGTPGVRRPHQLRWPLTGPDRHATRAWSGRAWRRGDPLPSSPRRRARGCQAPTDSGMLRRAASTAEGAISHGAQRDSRPSRPSGRDSPASSGTGRQTTWAWRSDGDLRGGEPELAQDRVGVGAEGPGRGVDARSAVGEPEAGHRHRERPVDVRDRLEAVEQVPLLELLELRAPRRRSACGRPARGSPARNASHSSAVRVSMAARRAAAISSRCSSWSDTRLSAARSGRPSASQRRRCWPARKEPSMRTPSLVSIGAHPCVLEIVPAGLRRHAAPEAGREASSS